MAFISNTGIDYDSAFAIKNIDLSLNGIFSSKNTAYSPTSFGIDHSTSAASWLKIKFLYLGL